ncbi:cysteine-rich venom protein Mr30-like [Tubulanus polymorphus]|uniref:cysteine-rich venom protein Mr30-like n=1 Tax=Tubulanus polymorphus TaxID=672921 RepID=UPI003DA56AF6
MRTAVISSWLLLLLATCVLTANIRFKRSATCATKFSSVSAEHTACKPTNPFGLSKRGVSANDKQVILSRHNYLRGHLTEYDQPAAANMMKLYWDKEVAMIAQKLADSCKFAHDTGNHRHISGRLTLGQNLALGHRDWTSAIDGWFNEEKDFKYGVGSTGGVVGHYTQLVWATSTRVGCGYADCTIGRFYVCNYGPAGNSGDSRKPYEEGTQGSKCPHTKDGNGLCDCGDKICLNGAKMDPNTCQCTCYKQKWFRKPDCGLVCSEAKDQWICATQGGDWGEDYCARYSNVPMQYCPIMCNTCPAGDVSNQPEGGTNIPSGSVPADGSTGGSTGGFNDGFTGGSTGGSTGGTSVDTSTATQSKGVCPNPDPIKCGLPTATFWPKSFCSYSTVNAECPVMCGTCTAPSCLDGSNTVRNIGDIFTIPTAQVKCTKSGYKLTTGCVVQGSFVAVGETKENVAGYGQCSCTKSGSMLSASCSMACNNENCI